MQIRVGVGRCEFCGKEFNYEKREDRGFKVVKYCSDECRKAAARKASYEKSGWSICKNCGKKFDFPMNKAGTGYNRTAKFCSRECDVAYWRKQNEDKYGWGICEQCGKKFRLEKKVSGRGYKQKKFCSIECEALHHKEISESFHEHKGDKYGICLECGKKFEQVWLGKYYSKSSFCSEFCREVYADKKYPNRVKYCRFCGKRVPLKFSNVKKGKYDISDYCSDECREAFERETSGKAVCPICGKTFYREAFVDYRGHRDYKKGFIFKYCSDCRAKLPRSSEAEQKAYIRFSQEGIVCDVQEYNVGDSYYDFKVTNFNILVDINPTFTHCLEPNFINSGKTEDYHYRRVEIAAKAGFYYICVWDWSSLDKVISLIKSLMNNPSSTQYTLKFHDTPEMLFYKNGEPKPLIGMSQKPAEDYFTVYNCGKYSYTGYEDIVLS